MTIEQKYHHAILVLQAISQHSGENEFGLNEWTQSEAFHDCREAARRCLLKLGESTELENGRKK